MPSFAEFVNEINEREAQQVPPAAEISQPGFKMYSWLELENAESRAWDDPVVTFYPYGPVQQPPVEIPLVRAPRNLVPPTPAVGDFFHGVENGMIIAEGQVLESTHGCLKVRLFDWWTGTPTAQAYVPAILYEDAEEMRDAYENYKTDWSLYETHEELYEAYVRYVKNDAPWGTTEQFEMNRKLCMEAEKRFEAPVGQVLPATPVKLPKARPAPMGEAAYHGIVGEFARLIEPTTEGDINAIIIAFLTAFGCLFNRKPHYYVEDTRHGTNLFSVIVGPSSKARKGTATDRVLNMLKLVDKNFAEDRVFKGLSTGEGLIYCVRDAREEPQLVTEGKDKRQPAFDPGVQDKRMLIIEPEFAGPLEHAKRDGNILSVVLRDAADGKPLRIMAKTNKDKCQEPHISVIGNITVDELQRCLSEKDRHNGFGNRILWAYAIRSKHLPKGGRPDRQALQSIADRIASVVAFQLPGEMDWSEDAYELWCREYVRLSDSQEENLVEAMSARGVSHVLRMAMIYAALDRSPLIERVHLEAALEVWRYCEDTVRFIFGSSSGNKLAEDILGRLLVKPEGMTQTELNVALGRNTPSSDLKAALDVLVRSGKIRSENRPSAGRPVTVWLASS
jgi:Protein of unknown function (DUF3987)